MKKKILWIILLVVILAAMIAGIVLSRKQEEKVAVVDTSFGKTVVSNETDSESSDINKEETTNVQAETDITNTTNTTDGVASNTVQNTANVAETNTTETSNSSNAYQKTKLSDGILYSKDGKEVTPDVVVNEKVFDTTINDMWLNPDRYMGKKIEIEGMYMENLPYLFVGRYSTSNVCPNCPTGYAYFEYQLDGEIDKKFTDEKEWIKVIGTFEVGNDASTNYTDFYYLKVLSLEVMNESGNKTVNN